MKFAISNRIGENFLKLRQSNPITCFFPCTSLKVKVFCDPQLASFENIVVHKSKNAMDKDFSLRELNEDKQPLNTVQLPVNVLQDIFDSIKNKLNQGSERQVGTIYFSGQTKNFTVTVYQEGQSDPIYTFKTSKEQPKQLGKSFLQSIDVFKGNDPEPRTKVAVGNRGEEEGLMVVAIFRPIAASSREVPADGCTARHRAADSIRRAAQAERSRRGGLITRGSASSESAVYAG